MTFRKREVDVIENFNVMVKEYVTGRVELIIYDRQLHRIKDGYEPTDKASEIKTSKAIKLERENEIRHDSVHRSYKLLIDYALQNSNLFKTFITLTFKENVTEIEQANKCFSNWVRSVKRIKNDFVYLGVPEFQKRGAVHYHLMTNIDVNNHELITLQLGKTNQFDVSYWSHGWASVFDLSLTDDKFSISAYLTKYFYKDIDSRLFGRKKILKSNNLSKPTVTRMLTESNEFQNYINYLNKSKHFLQKKHIQSEYLYAPSLTILSYK